MRFPPHFSILVLGYGVDRVQTCEACRPAVVARFTADPLLATLLLCLPLLVLVLAAFMRHRRAP